MGSIEDDSNDDRTVGLPPRLAKSPEMLKGLIKGSVTPGDKGKPSSKAPEHTPAPPHSHQHGDHDEYMGTIAPPPRPNSQRPSKGGTPSPPSRESAKPPESQPKVTENPWNPSSIPSQPEWTAFGSALSSPPIESAWDQEENEAAEGFDTALGPPRGPKLPAQPEPGNESHEFDQPWTIAGPPPIPNPSPIAKHLSPREERRSVPPQAKEFSPIEPATPQPPKASSPPRTSDGAHTVRIGRGMLPEAPVGRFFIQYFDGVRDWRDLEPILDHKHVIGRKSFGHNIASPNFLATEHLGIEAEGDRLYASPLNTINGVYLKLLPNQPIELKPGTRFQVGHHVIEFQLGGTLARRNPLVAPDGEEFHSRSLNVPASLLFIGPSNEPEVAVPLTKIDGSVIGREGGSCDIALPGDDWASRSHARISFDKRSFWLEDLQSTNGTFVKIEGRTPLRCGNYHNPGRSDILLIGAVLLRVVEK